MLSDIHDLYRQPIPVNLEHTDLKAHLESAVSSTYLHLNAGTCTSVKIGTTGMAPIKLLQNLQTALPEIIKRLAPTKRRRTEEGGEEEEDDLWGNIQSLMIKTSESASLPIWSCQLGSGQGGRWDGLVAEQKEMGVDEEEHDGLPTLSAKRKTVGPSLAEPSDATLNGKRKKRAAVEESNDEPKRKRKNMPVGTDEVVSEMKGLAIRRATPAKREKEAKAEGKKTVETNGPTAALIKIKAPSSTSVPPPNPESTRKPRTKPGEEKASRKVQGSLPSASATTRPPTVTKTGPAKADKEKENEKKTKAKSALAIDEKPTAEEKKEKKYPKGEKNPKLISTPKPTSLPLAHAHQHQAQAQAREKENSMKPLKSAIKSSSLSGGGGGVKEKKKISFDLRSGKEGRGGKKIGGKLSSKERLVGRGPRNA